MGSYFVGDVRAGTAETLANLVFDNGLGGNPALSPLLVKIAVLATQAARRLAARQAVQPGLDLPGSAVEQIADGALQPALQGCPVSSVKRGER